MNWDVTVAVVFLAVAVYAIVIGEWVAVVALGAASGVHLNAWEVSKLRRELDHLKRQTGKGREQKCTN